MPAADGRTLEWVYRQSRPRGFAAGPGHIDFQPDMSDHPPGALCAPRRHGHCFKRRSTFALAVPHGVAAVSKILHLLQRPGARRAVRLNSPRAAPAFWRYAPPRCVGPPAVGLRSRENARAAHRLIPLPSLALLYVPVLRSFCSVSLRSTPQKERNRLARKIFIPLKVAFTN